MRWGHIGKSIAQTAYAMEHLEQSKAIEVAANLQVTIDKTTSLKEKFWSQSKDAGIKLTFN